MDLDVEPGGAHRVDQFLDLGEAGLAAARLVAAVQQVELAAQVDHGGAAGVFDGGERAGGRAGVAREGQSCRAGVDSDGADVVGDDVVQVAGDGLALVGQRPVQGGVLLLLAKLFALFEFGDVGAAAGGVAAHQPGHDARGDAGDEQQPPVAGDGAAGGHPGPGRADRQQRNRDQGGPVRQPGAGAVARDQVSDIGDADR